MRWQLLAICALLAATAASDVNAQDGQQVLVGDRVRVRGASGCRVLGEVSLLSEAGLQLTVKPNGSTTTFDLAGLRSVEVHRGQRRNVVLGILG
ncbi:MAG: hypothetical protein EXR91_03700 [Gemmatimonadetes bacterium]|nr:hypothetical protein [Gemmatimonadota bacterium]